LRKTEVVALRLSYESGTSVTAANNQYA
jgi:hypothetical protein